MDEKSVDDMEPHGKCVVCGFETYAISSHGDFIFGVNCFECKSSYYVCKDCGKNTPVKTKFPNVAAYCPECTKDMDRNAVKIKHGFHLFTGYAPDDLFKDERGYWAITTYTD